LKYTTISDKQAIGICGSAVIDIIAMLLENGIIDETGRFNEEDDIKSEIGSKLSDRIKNIDGQLAFIITQNTLTGEVIAITQKDIREIQLAKAAIIYTRLWKDSAAAFAETYIIYRKDGTMFSFVRWA
jgi:uncharacterized 2Fe-2S/4Fe-4S cluster protein (DUF4445 family)